MAQNIVGFFFNSSFIAFLTLFGKFVLVVGFIVICVLVLVRVANIRSINFKEGIQFYNDQHPRPTRRTRSKRTTKG